MKQVLRDLDKENQSFRTNLTMLISLAKKNELRAELTGNEALGTFANEVIRMARRELEK